MKKSNKISIFYIISSLSLFVLLICGGCYGIYMSVGLSFVRNGVSNLTEGVAQNVSFGATANFSSSMIGVISLSVILIILSIFDFILLIKQISFFKQFKMVRESSIEKKIESKIKTKSGVIALTIILDLVAIVVGIIGVIVNSQTFSTGNMSWSLSLIDGLVSLFSLVSMILLIIKLKTKSKIKESSQNNHSNKNYILSPTNKVEITENQPIDIDQFEYNLLKLKHLKSLKIINNDEYESLRQNIIGLNQNTLTKGPDKDEPNK